MWHALIDRKFLTLTLPVYQCVPTLLLWLVIVSLALFTDRSKVLEFFRAHRDTLVILLKTEVSDLSVSVLEEVCLIVTLGISVLPSVQKTELVRQRNNKLTQGH